MAKQTKITKSARGEDCTMRLPEICCFDPETTVLAHLPTSRKGMGIKSHDIHGAFLCHRCHDVIDGRNMSHSFTPAELWQSKFQALTETQLLLLSKGLIKVT